MIEPTPGACALPDMTDARREAADRAAELDELGILDTAPERAYDDLAAVAAHVCAAPVALVSLLDATRQWFKAEVGLGQRELGLERTICVHTIASGGDLAILDLAADPRTADSPLVTQDGFRFYAGSAIRGRGGVPLGALCVLDRVPRPEGLSPAQSATLAALARQVSTLLEHRRALAQIAKREAELAASERLFRVMNAAMPQMVWTTLPDGFHDYYNDRWYEFTGVPVGSTDGEAWNGMFHPDDQERAWARWRHSLATGEPYEIEYRLRHHSGAYRWTLGRAMPVRDAQGRIERWFGTCTDIDALKRAEESRDLLIRELSHRIKNIFAVVGGLAALTARGDPSAKPFAAAFRERLGALARAHEYVRPHSPDSAPAVAGQTVLGLMRLLMAAYVEDGRERVAIAGEDAEIGERTATALALIMHEQATNAMKYGALSRSGGRVSLTGRRGDGRFMLTWAETGGPPVTEPPRHKGFGTILAERSITGQLDGVLERDWAPSGLVMRLDVPVENLRH